MATALKATRSSLMRIGSRRFTSTKTTQSDRSNEDEYKVIEGIPIHVRVTLISVSGIKAEHAPKQNKSKSSVKESSVKEEILDETIPVKAFCAMMKKGGDIGPIAPSAQLDVTDPSRHTFSWENSQNSSPITRVMCFSSVLSKEDNKEPNASPATGELYAPEIFDVCVGILKGESMVNLGVATFVVSDEEVKGLRMDLPVREREAANGKKSNGGSGPNSPKRKVTPSPSKKKGFRKLFGLNKSSSQDQRFGDEQRVFTIAPNATLRIKLDVKRNYGNILEESPSVWGDSYTSYTTYASFSEDVSYGPITVYDLNTASGLASALQSRIPVTPDSEEGESIEVMKGVIGTTVISSGGSQATPQDKYSTSRYQDNDDESQHTNFVISSVVMKSPESFDEERKRMREMNPMTPTSLLNTMALSVCGDPTVVDDERLIQGLSFDSTIPEDPTNFRCGTPLSGPLMNAAKKQLSVRTRSPLTVTTNTNSRKSGRSSTRPLDLSMLENESSSDSDEAEEREFGEDDEDDDDDDSFEEATVGDETIDSVNHAKDTLMRYASRVGVEIEDLLDADVDAGRMRSSVTGSRRTLGSRRYLPPEESSESDNDSKSQDEDDDDSCTVDSGDGVSTIGSSTFHTYSTYHSRRSRKPK